MPSFHQWIDILTVVGVFTGGVISTIVGWRLSRSDLEREKIHEALGELRQDLVQIKGWIAGKFGVQL